MPDHKKHSFSLFKISTYLTTVLLLTVLKQQCLWKLMWQTHGRRTFLSVRLQGSSLSGFSSHYNVPCLYGFTQRPWHIVVCEAISWATLSSLHLICCRASVWFLLPPPPATPPIMLNWLFSPLLFSVLY